MIGSVVIPDSRVIPAGRQVEVIVGGVLQEQALHVYADRIVCPGLKNNLAEELKFL